MLNIGCHVSSAKGYLAMGKDIVSMGGNVFAFFTRNYPLTLGSLAILSASSIAAIVISFGVELDRFIFIVSRWLSCPYI